MTVFSPHLRPYLQGMGLFLTVRFFVQDVFYNGIIGLSDWERQGVFEMSDKKRFTSEWMLISELKPVEIDISDFGYKKEYIEEHGLNETKVFHWSNSTTGVMNYFEPLEVKSKDGLVYYRINENYVHMNEPDFFDTQFGRFNNHNRGEFDSWLGKDGYEGLQEKEREMNALFDRSDYFIEGNFCDMFDCGEYAYAVSNLMHMGLGEFKIVRIDKNLEAVTLYCNSNDEGWNSFKYLGRFENEQGHVVIVSGITQPSRSQPDIPYKERTLLLQIDYSGSCTIIREWNYCISSPNSMVEFEGFVYFGQNKMVTRLNVETGEIAYFTNKSNEELDALVEWEW